MPSTPIPGVKNDKTWCQEKFGIFGKLNCLKRNSHAADVFYHIRFFYKQHIYKQRQAEIGKKLSKS